MKIVQCSICMAAMSLRFFFVIIDIFVKLLGLYDRTLRRRYMAGFSSPLLANFRTA